MLMFHFHYFLKFQFELFIILNPLHLIQSESHSLWVILINLLITMIVFMVNNHSYRKIIFS